MKKPRQIILEQIKAHITRIVETVFNTAKGNILSLFLLICLRIRLRRHNICLKEFLIHEKVINSMSN